MPQKLINSRRPQRTGWLAPLLTRPQRLVALALTAVAYWLVCFAPYDWIAPASYTLNDARLVAANNTEPDTLVLQGTGIAEWPQADQQNWQITPSSVHLMVSVRCELSEQFGPARIVSLSSDPQSRNLTLGQDGSALILRLLRPGSNPNGVPEYRVERFFERCRTRDIDLQIADGALQLRSAGELLLNIAAPKASLERWLSAHPLVFGNEVSWDRGWSGALSQLSLSVNGEAIVTGVRQLQLPHGAWLLSHRAQRTHRFTLVPFSREGGGSLVDNLANVLGFLPFGVLLALGWGSRLNGLYAGVLAALLSGSIEIGQIGFAGRYPSATDLTTNTLGGILGFVAGWFWLRRKRSAESRGAQEEQHS